MNTDDYRRLDDTDRHTIAVSCRKTADRNPRIDRSIAAGGEIPLRQKAGR